MVGKQKERFKTFQYFTPYHIDYKIFQETFKVHLVNDRNESRTLSFADFYNLQEREGYEVFDEAMNTKETDDLDHFVIKVRIGTERYDLKYESDGFNPFLNNRITWCYHFWRSSIFFLGNYDAVWFEFFNPYSGKKIHFFSREKLDWIKPYDTDLDEELILYWYQKFIHSDSGSRFKSILKYGFRKIYSEDSYEKRMWKNYFRYDDYFLNRNIFLAVDSIRRFPIVWALVISYLLLKIGSLL